MRHRPATLVLPLALAACASDGGPYPSLTPRPVEKLSFDEPSRPQPVASPDATLDAAIAARSADLVRIAAGFEAAADAAQRAIGRAAHQAVGSDAWLDAQTALAQLDDWRAQGNALTAAIEAMGSERAARLAPAYPPLDALAARAAAESERESARVEALQRQVRPA